MVIAISPEEQREYICEADQKLGASDQTVWLLRYFTVTQHSHLINKMKGDKTEPWGDLVLLVLRGGLVGVRNFKDRGGIDVPFEATQLGLLGTPGLKIPTDAFLSKVPAAVREELFGVILKQAREEERLTEEERKN